MDPKERTAKQFSDRASAYASSPGHASGADLDIILRLLEPRPSMRVLDVATGPGHTAVAVAPFVREVVGVDIAGGMIAEARANFSARGLAHALALTMDAEALGFRDASFDAVTCRVAPHHFPNVRAALAEVARVLVPGGVFVLEDSCSSSDPAIDRFLNAAEFLRDPTHVRSHTEREWTAMLESAGFTVTRREIFRKEHPFEHWLQTAGVSDEIARAMREVFASAPSAAKEELGIRVENGVPVSFFDEKLIVRAEYRDRETARDA